MSQLSSIATLLDECGLSGRVSVGELTLAECAQLFAEQGRSALLAHVRQAGTPAGHAAKLANAVSRAVREGRVAGISDARVPHADAVSGSLLTASRDGDVERIKSVLGRRGLSHERDSEGSTPLMISCASGHVACARLMLAARADHTVSRSDGSNALTDAVQRGWTECAALLLHGGADATGKLHHGWDALSVASLHGHADCVRLLLDAAADPQSADEDDASALSIAAQHGHEACVDVLLSAGADAEKRRSDGLTPLALAAACGHCGCTGLLLEAGARTDTRDKADWLPLLYAAFNGHLGCVRGLLEASADANAGRRSGFNALMAAASSGQSECMRALLDAGALVRAPKLAAPPAYGNSSRASDGSRHSQHAAGAAGATSLTLATSDGGWAGGAPGHLCPYVPDAATYAQLGEAAAACLAILTADANGTRHDEGGPASSANGEIASSSVPTLERVTFRAPLGLTADECWQERPVRRVAERPKERGWELYYCSNTGLHGVSIVQLVLRDHGFRRLPPVTQPKLKRSVRRSWFARGALGLVDDRSGSVGSAAITDPSAQQSTTVTCRPHGSSASTQEARSWCLNWHIGRLDGSMLHCMLPHQKVNKFPGASALTLKHELWRHFRRMQRCHGVEQFGYMPTTYELPAEHDAWTAARVRDAASTPLWIVKPSNSSRSRGIHLVRACAGLQPGGSGATQEPAGAAGEPLPEEEAPGGEAADGAAHARLEPGQHGVASAYIHPPLTLDGLKFDVRLYVLVTSWCPLVVYLYRGGIARCASEPYSLFSTTASDSQPGGASGPRSGHFTNFSCSEEGPRLMLDTLHARLTRELGEVAATQLWHDVDDLVVKMVITVEGPMSAELAHCSRDVANGHPNAQCFELFGIDVLIGADGKPWLLEVNMDPSLDTGDMKGTAAGANAQLKSHLVADLFNVVGITPPHPASQGAASPSTEGSPASALPSMEASAKQDLEAMAAAEYARMQASHRLSAEAVRQRTLQHVNQEYARSLTGGWRRLLPSPASETYAALIDEPRRELNLLPFDGRDERESLWARCTDI